MAGVARTAPVWLIPAVILAPIVTPILAPILALWASAAPAEDQKVDLQMVPLPFYGFVALPLPADAETDLSDDQVPPLDISYRGADYRVQLSFMWWPGYPEVVGRTQRLRQTLEGGMEKARANALEKDIAITTVERGAARGMYYSYTLQSPPAEELARRTAGAVATPSVWVFFTVSSRAGDAKPLERFLLTLEYLEHRWEPESFEAGLEAYEGGEFYAAITTMGHWALKGRAEAQFYLARMHLRGEGTGVNPQEAARWMERAAEQGYEPAQLELAILYERGQGVRRSMGQALDWYRAAAAQGNSDAAVAIGVMYEKGLSVSADAAEAARWFVKAAEGGQIWAQNKLGSLYLMGKGVPRDEERAAFWYRKAAEGGDMVAQSNLATFYKNGQGVPMDLAEAARWYKESAEQGFSVARNSLGLLYEEGRGVERNPVQAYFWFTLAQEQGNDDARANRDRVARNMSREQVAAAKELLAQRATQD